MEKQIETKERLKKLLYCIKCKGEDFRNGGCPLRCHDECQRINKLDICMIECIANNLVDNNVIVMPCKVGDKINMPWEWNGVSGVASLTVESIKINKQGYFIYTNLTSDDDEYLIAYDHGVFNFDDIGKKIFL